MKKFTSLILLALLPLLASAQTLIDGIYYNLDASKQEAAVTSGGYGYYTGSVTIPESFTYNGVTYNVTSIGDNAFRYCSGLTSVTIGSSVTEIGDNAFDGCWRLTSVTIPNSVTEIGSNAFDCLGLTNISVESGNTKYDSRDKCNAIIETSSNKLITGCKNTIIPNSVTSIGGGAFSGCSGLTEVTIPNSVTSIGEGAFLSCYYLTSVTIPNSVTSIGDNAFSYCSGLTSVTIGSSVTEIGSFAFSGCSGLTNISVESGNTKYDSRDNCNAIIETASNTLIAGCKNTIIPNSVTSIEYDAFYGCSGLTSVTIPNSVTSIGEFAFAECSGLTSVTIPNSVTSIGGGAFSGCSGLTSVTIPNSLTSIGVVAFSGCSGLTSVTIPNSVTSIGNCAFYNCSSLTDVYCYAVDVPTTDDSAFSSWSGEYIDSATLYVPRASIDAYKTTSPWSEFGTIKAIEDITGIKNVSAEGNGTADGKYLPDGKYLKDGKLVIIKGGKEYDAAGAVK